MALKPRNTTVMDQTRSGADIDAGLRAYMLRVYNYMTLGLLVTGVVSYSVANTSLINFFYARTAEGFIQPTMLAYIAMFAPLIFIFGFSKMVNSMRASSAQFVFYAFAGVMGISLTHIFMTYTGESIVRVFFITSGTFAAMSLYGYTTKRDLTGMGSFLMMGLIGIIIASVVNIFMQSTMMYFIISVVGVLVFVGLTAYDTQQIKNTYAEQDSSDVSQKKAIFGALRLYLDFINLFIMLLHLFGNRN